MVNVTNSTDDLKWVGVDLDGTLAQYDTHISLQHIGEPIPLMVERVQRWLQQGIKVKIFTARVSCPLEDYSGAVQAIEDWCEKHIGQKLPITNIKDLHMEELWDDRAVQVLKNTGMPIGTSTRGLV